MTPQPGAWREAHGAASRDAHRPKKSLPGAIGFVLLSVGLLVAASYPELAAAATLGAVTAVLGRRAQRAIDGWSPSFARRFDLGSPASERRTTPPR